MLSSFMLLSAPLLDELQFYLLGNIFLSLNKNIFSPFYHFTFSHREQYLDGAWLQSFFKIFVKCKWIPAAHMKTDARDFTH